MTPVLRDRAPTHAECFQAFVGALERLTGQCDRTSDAIEVEIGADAPDFHRAAHAAGVKIDDLVDAFRDEMFRRGFVVGRRWAM